MVENQTPKPTNDAIVANTKSSQVDLSPVAEKQLKNVIDMEKIAAAIIPKASELTTRTVQRIYNEKQIINDVERLLEIFNKNLKVMSFGSATYGFGGSDTNFNICLVNDGNKILYTSIAFNLFSYINKFRNFTGNPNQSYTDKVFEKFVAFFKTPIVKKVFRFFRDIKSDRVQKNRIHASHLATKIVCVIQIDINDNIIESSQIVRDCLLKEPICEYSSEC